MCRLGGVGGYGRYHQDSAFFFGQAGHGSPPRVAEYRLNGGGAIVRRPYQTDFPLLLQVAIASHKPLRLPSVRAIFYRIGKWARAALRVLAEAERIQEQAGAVHRLIVHLPEAYQHLLPHVGREVDLLLYPLPIGSIACGPHGSAACSRPPVPIVGPLGIGVGGIGTR